MTIWADEMILQYKKFRDDLIKKRAALNKKNPQDKLDLTQYNSMIEEMDFIPDITEQLEVGPKHLFMSPEEKIILAEIFASLSFRERHCYILHVGGQLSVRKIAEDLGV